MTFTRAHVAALLEQATPGPWTLNVMQYSTYYNAKVLVEPSIGAVFEDNANAALIAAAPTIIAEQAAEIERLREALVGLVGSDVPTELDAMELVIRSADAPDADKAVSINAINAIRGAKS